MPRFPGIGFRGDGPRRRPWVIGTALDVWEICQLVDDYGSVEKLVSETHLVDREVRSALAYREHFPEEVGAAVAENQRTADEWHELYPFVRVAAAPPL